MKLGHFLEDEAGAVTVDWVVLTAALVGLGLAVTTVVKGGIESKANEIDHFLADDVVIRVAFVEDGISTARDDACALSGTLCDPSLSESGLARLSISQLDALEAQDYAAAYIGDLNGSGLGRTYSADDEGVLTYNGGLAASAEEQQTYTNNVLASAAQNALIAEERAARATQARD